MGSLLVVHISVSIGLIVCTVLRAASGQDRRQVLRWSQSITASGSVLSGLALAAQGASVTHLCLSGAALIAVIAGIEVYARSISRPNFTRANRR